MRWRLLFLFLFFFLLGRDIHAQSRHISGVVLDGRTVTLLSGVKINCGSDTATITTDADGKFNIQASGSEVMLKFQLPGYQAVQQKVLPRQHFTTVFLHPEHPEDASGTVSAGHLATGATIRHDLRMPVSIKAHQDETYEQVSENPFKNTDQYPLSSFTLNADKASYCNIRRFITGKETPPKEAVRIEEMVNYFPYSYSMDAVLHHLLSFRTDITTCPWHPGHWLMRLAVQAKKLPGDTMLANNLMLLVDVSGSMEAPNKLPLLKKAFRVLVHQLDSLDKVAIVVYAGNVSVALPSTPGSQKNKILDVINNLSAGGSTAGKAGIELAFKLAKENLIPGGNNRVIMATDGDFNVGSSSDADMRKLITKYHDWGIYLTCIGVGMGNYKDSKLETLAQWGQGNFVYIDNDGEAESVFGPDEYQKILVTAVKNACIKTVFNPEIIKSYRLIGHESKAYGEDDTLTSDMPGGEIGFGQSITAFYELEPVRDKQKLLMAGKDSKTISSSSISPEMLATIALQYQSVSDGIMHLIIKKVPSGVQDFKQADDDLQFAGEVALFGMLLRHSDFSGEGTYDMVEKLVRRLKGRVYKSERKAFSKLVQKAAQLEKTAIH